MLRQPVQLDKSADKQVGIDQIVDAQADGAEPPPRPFFGVEQSKCALELHVEGAGLLVPGQGVDGGQAGGDTKRAIAVRNYQPTEHDLIAKKVRDIPARLDELMAKVIRRIRADYRLAVARSGR